MSVYSCCNPTKAPLSLLCCLSVAIPAPPSEKRPMCGVGKCLPPSFLRSGERGVSTKEIPKVPLQWHSRTLWKLACPLTLQQIFARLKLIRNPWNPPLPLLRMIFFASSVCASWGGVSACSKRECREKALLYVLTSSFAFFLRCLFIPRVINQNFMLALSFSTPVDILCVYASLWSTVFCRIWLPLCLTPGTFVPSLE